MDGHLSVVAMDNYRAHKPEPIDPLEHLYRLERDLEAAERRTFRLIEDLTARLDRLEERISSVSGRVDGASRSLEREIVRLADRIAELEAR